MHQFKKMQLGQFSTGLMNSLTCAQTSTAISCDFRFGQHMHFYNYFTAAKPSGTLLQRFQILGHRIGRSVSQNEIYFLRFLFLTITLHQSDTHKWLQTSPVSIGRIYGNIVIIWGRVTWQPLAKKIRASLMDSLNIHTVYK